MTGRIVHQQQHHHQCLTFLKTILENDWRCYRCHYVLQQSHRRMNHALLGIMVVHCIFCPDDPPLACNKTLPCHNYIHRHVYVACLILVSTFSLVYTSNVFWFFVTSFCLCCGWKQIKGIFIYLFVFYLYCSKISNRQVNVTDETRGKLERGAVLIACYKNRPYLIWCPWNKRAKKFCSIQKIGNPSSD